LRAEITKVGGKGCVEPARIAPASGFLAVGECGGGYSWKCSRNHPRHLSILIPLLPTHASFGPRPIFNRSLTAFRSPARYSYPASLRFAHPPRISKEEGQQNGSGIRGRATERNCRTAAKIISQATAEKTFWREEKRGKLRSGEGGEVLE